MSSHERHPSNVLPQVTQTTSGGGRTIRIMTTPRIHDPSVHTPCLVAVPPCAGRLGRLHMPWRFGIKHGLSYHGRKSVGSARHQDSNSHSPQSPQTYASSPMQVILAVMWPCSHGLDFVELPDAIRFRPPIPQLCSIGMRNMGISVPCLCRTRCPCHLW